MGLFFSLVFALSSPSVLAEPNLIGGQLAVSGQFPFVVNIGGCTATKIGPREFLTAAHCFFTGPGKWRAPGKVSVRATEIAVTKDYRLTVVAIRLHPTWVEKCGTDRCTGNETGGRTDLPGKVDLAHVIVREESPEIPAIAVENATLETGAAVTFVGYGCIGTLGGPGSGRLRFAANRVGTPELLRHEGSLYREIAAVTGESYTVSAGTAMDPKVPGLCPGDSGGPLLVRAGGAWKIAGIASDYSFRGKYEASGSVPMTNLHVRLDDRSRHQIGAWIRLGEN